MLFPWAAVRAVSAKVFVKADRAVRNASSVGPSGGVNGLTDEENQAALALTDLPDPVKERVKEQISIFTVMKIVTILSALYVGANPWFEARSHQHRDRFMCPRLVVCAPTLLEMILLTGSRFTAGLIYPGLVISIFSKCYATRSFLHHSWLGAVIDLEPSHDIHTYFGYLTLVAGLVHSILHAARYIYANMAYIMYETDAGRSGVIACALLLPIVLPMKFEYFRTKMSFQFRKSLHMLFLPMIIALCFHSMVFRYVGFILVVWYTLDRIYFTTKQTFLIDHPVFEAVGRGTMVTLDLPAGYTFKAGSYIYVNSPMISRSEWHPFSIIQVPGSPPRATFYAEAVGDWTKELFRLGLEQPRLPLWITAAQPSLMEKSIYYDNTPGQPALVLLVVPSTYRALSAMLRGKDACYDRVVLVCTGAGITPAVSIIERFTKRKNLHLLWMSRDGGLVALFEKQLRQVRSTVHLTGRPDDETKIALQSLLEPPVAPSAVDASARMGFRSATPMPRRPMDDSGFSVAPRNGDADDLDSLPPRPMLLSNLFPTLPEGIRVPATSKACTSDPVKLVFGRPDIAAYLTETFATQPGGPPCTGKDDDLDTPDPSSEGSVSTLDVETASGGLHRERSRRLNTSQEVSKMTLLKADATVLDEDQKHRGDKRKGKLSFDDDPSLSAPSRPLRWLVLYCGANPKVEEAIAKTCDELRVNWQKEYFGAW